MFGIGAGEFIVILIVGLIVFGPSKLPEVGRAIGKGLREFRKAQAALSQTLNEVDESVKSPSPAKTTTETSVDKKPATVDKPPVKPLTTESFIGDKATVTQTVTPSTTESFVGDRPATVDKTSVDDKPVTVDKPPQVTADDVIKFAKERPLVNENQNEKISDGNPVDAANNAARPSAADTRGSADGVDKQP